MAVSICTLNVNGIAELHKREKVFTNLLDKHFDIYLLQETHLPDVTQGELWEKQWGGRALWSPGTNRSAGVGLLLHPGSAIEIVDHKSDTDGRVLSVKLKLNDQFLQLINVYAPNKHSDRENFFATLWRLAFRNVDTIVAGDFNCVPDAVLDKWGGDDTFGDKGIPQLHAFADSLSLEDVFRAKYPTEKLFTWFNGPHSVGCRLDRFYTPHAWRSRVRDHKGIPFSYSDHHLVSITVQLGHSNPRGRGVWKFNTRLLKSENFCADVNNFWPQWQSEKPVFSDPRVWWDAGKLQLKEIAIAHSVKAANTRKRERAALDREFHNLQSRADPNNAAHCHRLLEIKDLLRAMDDEATEGCILRSKEQWTELGEKPTRYFYQLENSHQTRHAIHEIRVDNNNTVKTSRGVLRECNAFYSTLYTEEPVDRESQDWLLEQLDSTLSSEDQALCEGELTVLECHEALSRMESGKSPGSDGFPAEFYSRFWGLLGRDLVETLNFSFREGFLSASQRRGILRLLFKKDDPLSLKNWRPISLLNLDYKIATKALSNRIRKVLPNILSEDQTCGVPGRSIFENLFLLRDTIDFARLKHLPAAVISLDQEKAFDRVNHPFLQRVLEKFNFGPDFRRWVQVIYTDITSMVINNGWLSSPFPLQRGVRQGCPLSPLLYCLVVETLGQAIRRDTSIQGIQIPGSKNKQCKVSQYADDTTLILANDYSITRAFNLINIFERGSGSRLNPKKTEGLWIGSQAGRTSGPVNITWVADKLKILGVYLGNSNLDQANWADRVKKLETRLNLWRSRTLSLKGKAMIINTLGASGLWYTATVVNMPDWVHTRVSKAIWNFLWNGKTELVKRDTCRLPWQHGGLSVVNPLEKSRALKLRWVPPVGDVSCEKKWVFFARYWIGFPLSRRMKSWTFLRSNEVPKHLGDSKPPIYQAILTAVDRIGVDFDLLSDHSVKTFYSKLTPPPPQRLPCAFSWERRFDCSLNWSNIWGSIYGGLSTNWESDIAWRIAHGVVKTRAYLKSWRRLPVSDRCARCGEPETISHAFCSCRLVSPVWSWVSTLINRLYDKPLLLTNPIILLRHGLPQGKHHLFSNELSSFLIKITLNELWAARNLDTFESKRPSVHTIISKIKGRIRHRVRAAYNISSGPDFFKSWTHRNVLCSYANQTLSIHI